MLDGQSNHSLRTKQALLKAMCTLLETASFQDIKISEICKEAKMSRTTFYLHFEDKVELAAFFVKDMLWNIDQTAKTKMDSLDLFFTYVDENRIIIQNLMSNNAEVHAAVIRWFSKTLYENYLPRAIDGKIHEVPVDVIALFYASGLAIVTTAWVQGSLQCSKEELINHIHAMNRVDPYTIP